MTDVERVAFVRVAELGSVPQEIQVLEGATVGDVLVRAGVAEGLQVRLNGQPAAPEDPVSDGDTLVAFPKIAGGV